MSTLDIGFLRESKCVLFVYELEHLANHDCWYRLIIDGQEISESLMDMVIRTLKENSTNSVIAFRLVSFIAQMNPQPTNYLNSSCDNRDNSSTIKGFATSVLSPSQPGQPSSLQRKSVFYNPLLTAETHNFPTGE